MAVAFDGRYIWATNVGADSTAVGDGVAKIDPTLSVSLGNAITGTDPHGVAFDGTNMWVANRGGGITRLLP
jgi:DNA-binding beta-propeller fold protein YncE